MNRDDLLVQIQDIQAAISGSSLRSRVTELRQAAEDCSSEEQHETTLTAVTEIGKAIKELLTATDTLQSQNQELVNLSQTLQESEQRYRLLCELTTDFAYSIKVSAEGKMVTEWLSDAFFTNIGYDVNELSVPSNWKRIIHPDDWSVFEQEMITLLGGQSTQSECRLITKNGEVRWLQSYRRPLFDQEQRVIQIIGASQDITDRKHKEQEIHIQARLLDAVEQAVIANDMDMNIIYWNDYATKLYGWSKAEAIGCNGITLLAPSEVVQAGQLIREVSSGNSSKTELELRHKDGSRFIAEVTGSPIFDAQGQQIGLVGISYDVSDRLAADLARQKLNQELEIRVTERTNELEQAVTRLQAEISERQWFATALSQREQEFRALVENVPLVIARFDEELRYLYINSAIEQVSGKLPQEIIGKTLYQVANGDANLRLWEEAILWVFDTGEQQAIEFTYQTPTGLKYYQALFVPELTANGLTHSVLGICNDISDYKQTLAALGERQEQLRAIFEGAGIGIAQTSLDGRLMQTNLKLQEMLGYSAEELKNRKLIEFTHSDDAVEDQEFSELVSGQLNLYHKEKRYLRKDNQMVWANLTVSLVRGFNEQPLFTIPMLEDISERKQADLALQESEQRFRQLAESISEVFWMITPDGSKQIYVSPAYEVVWGRTCASLYQDRVSWLEGVHPLDRERVAAAYRGKLAVEFNQEYRVVRPDGSTRWIRDRSFPIRDEQDNFYRVVGISEDITECKQAEIEACNALIKERELGELKSRFVSMTSHDFRTPLAVIQSSAELLELYHQQFSVDRQKAHLMRIQNSVAQMTQMLNDILIISEVDAGKLEFNPEPLDIVKFCQGLVEELQLSNRYQKAIAFTYQYNSKFTRSEQQELDDSSSCLSLMDEKLLRRIFSNLLSNALKYSPADTFVQFNLTCSDNTAVFKVKDQGIGVPPEDQKHLFEPFHRANNVGTIQGTGLGLAIVKQCVELHQGNIMVASVVGDTTFTVTLPLNYSIPLM